MAPVILAKGLHKCYAGFAPVLRGANLEVFPGEMVAVMGPSGCGKSTMLHILGMLHAPDAGTLEILGRNVLTFDREQTAAFRRGNMGFVMQASNLFDHSTVFENVEFPLIYERVPPEERWERVIRALELVRLSARVHYRSNRLSGGEQQRVAIARAMVNNPRILLADEPTGALDTKTSRLIMDNFRALCHTGGVSLVMVTHDPKMAEFCDSIYTLEEGQLCLQRHTVPEVPHQGARGLLQGPEPVVHGALVAERFPEATGQRLMDDAQRLHRAGVLSRIYALQSTGILGNPQGYALPLAVRRIGLLRLCAALPGLLRHVRGASGQLWRLWRARPRSREHVRAFFSGILLARWGHEEGIEFFYAAGAHEPATAAWVASRLLHVPFAIAPRAVDMDERHQPGWLMKAADASFVTCPTRAALNALRTSLEDRVFLLRPPLTLPPSEETAPSDQKPSLALLAVGPLLRSRGYDILVRACALLRKRKLDFFLTIAGQGPEKLRLRWLVWRLGLRPVVRFMGHVPHENMADLYIASDLVILPGRPVQGERGAMPAILLEAMACGRVVIAGNMPGYAEAVEDGVTGCLVPTEDPLALADTLEALGRDSAGRCRMGEAGRAAVEGFARSDPGMGALVELIRSACGRENRSPSAS